MFLNECKFDDRFLRFSAQSKVGGMRRESPEQRQPDLPELLKAANARLISPGGGTGACLHAFVDPREEAAIRPAH
jgi:hypothetical protein